MSAAPPLRIRLMPILPVARRRGIRIAKFHNLYVVTDPDSRFMAVAIYSPDCDSSDLLVSLAEVRS